MIPKLQFSLRGMWVVTSLFAVSFGLLRNAFYGRSLGRALLCFVAGSFILAGTIGATIERLIAPGRKGIRGAILAIIFAAVVIWLFSAP